MKTTNLILGLFTLIAIFFTSCKDETAILTADFIDGNSGWYGDTVKFNVIIEATKDFNLKITNNHDNQTLVQDIKSGKTTIEYGYIVPTDLTEGDVVSVSFTVTIDGSSKPQTIVKDISITASGNHDILYHHGTITTNETWLASNTHIVDGDFIVSGCKLTIEPGTIIKVQKGFYIKIYGQNAELTATGTSEAPITFTSASTTPTAGDWDGIYFASGINNTTILKFCNITYGGSSTSYGAVTLSDASIKVENCQISKSASYGVKADANSFTSFTNNTIKECANYAIKISANNVQSIGTGNDITSNLGIEITGGTVSSTNAFWNRQTVPFILSGDLLIKGANNPKLTIQKGTTLLLKSGIRIIIGGTDNFGTLIAKGSSDSLITISSASSTPQAGDWSYIQFNEGSTDCLLEYCTIKYGGGSSSWGMIDIENNALVSVKNCNLSNFQYYGVEADDDNGFVEFSNNTITKTSGHAIKIRGKHVKDIGTGNVFNVDANSGILVTGGSEAYAYISQNVAWLKQNCAYYIEDPIVVRNNATLTIEAGSVLKFIAGKYLQVGYSTEYGQLIAEGNGSEHITFTSASPSPQKGDWGSIRFETTTTTGSNLEYCDISYGGSSSSFKGNITVEPCGANTPSITDCNIDNSAYYGIYKKKVSLNLGNPSIYNCSYNDNNLGNIGHD